MTDSTSNGSLQRRLEALAQAVCRINTLQPIDDLLLEMAEEGARAMEAQRCTVWLVDEERGELYSRVAMGITDRQLRMPKYNGIAGDTLRTGRMTNVPDAAADPRFNAVIGQSEEFRTRSLLSIPMTNRRGEAIGVFQVLNKDLGRPFDAQDERLALALAAAAAVAVQNARDYESVKNARDRLDSENARLKLSFKQSFEFREFVAASPAVQRVIDVARRVSDSDVSVLVTGESGTGKTLLAKCLHAHSPRHSKPFVEFNCAAIPETLLEAELFGIEKGVATGVDRRLGKLESANGGTIFLDEIADMSLATQAKILRVVQEKSFERVGSTETRRVDVRILSATNKDLPAEIVAGRFREDLYYRLNVVSLHLPPLRERREDIPALATHLLQRLARRFERSTPPRLSDEAMRRLAAYAWPGNVREMENEISRCLVLAGDRAELSAEDLSDKLRDGAGAKAGGAARAAADLGQGSLADQVEALERQLIDQARAASEGNKSLMARLLGLSREGLRKKMARYHLE
jgi:Nif-specific regulatory protein